MMKLEQQSTWRQILEENWDEMRSQLDWMGLDQMHDHVAMVQLGGPRSVVGDWIEHAKTVYLDPLANRLGRKLNMVSFGCAVGSIERAVLERGWPIGRLVFREYDAELLEAARANSDGLCLNREFQQFDFNNPDAVGYEQFDIAFFCHSMHHCTDIERFLPYLSSIILPNGVILGLDYFGPNRLQVEWEVKALLDEIFSALPEHLRVNLRTGQVENAFYVDTADAVASGDPSEAARSADLRSLLFSNFPVLEVKPMGGTLLRPLLSSRAGNFRSDSDRCIVSLLCMLERELIHTRRIQSDNLFFALSRSDRLQAPARP